MPFFVPWTPSDREEKAFGLLAKMANQPPPALADRIYSISFKHNGETWHATVVNSCTVCAR